MKTICCKVIFLSIIILSCNEKGKSVGIKIRGGNVEIQKFEDKPNVTPLEKEEIELLEKYPSLKEVFHDFGNYWVNSKDTNNCLLFDYYEGKILQFKSIKIINTQNTDNGIFVFKINNYQPLKIVGEYGFRDGDTLMHWTFDEKRKVLVNEKGVIFKQIKVN